MWDALCSFIQVIIPAPSPKPFQVPTVCNTASTSAALALREPLIFWRTGDFFGIRVASEDASRVQQPTAIPSSFFSRILSRCGVQAVHLKRNKVKTGLQLRCWHGCASMAELQLCAAENLGAEPACDQFQVPESQLADKRECYWEVVHS